MPEQTEHQTFVAAFFAMQRELPVITKDSVAEIPNQKARKYADLKALVDAVMPLFGKYGFIWSCQPTVVDEKPMMRYELTHLSHTDEKPQQRTGLYPIYGDNKPQALGAALTYAMRNALRAVVVLTPEDEEDAEGPKPGAARTVSRKAPVKAATPADPDAVPGVPLPGEPTGMITRPMQNSMFAMLTKLGLGGKDDESKAKARAEINRVLAASDMPPIEKSSSELTLEAARVVLDGLKRELDARTTGSETPA